MSWAAHEFENYFIQKHVGVRASFLGITVGTMAPDLFTKSLLYGADEPAAFHRGWPGVGFTHSFAFGLALALVVLVVARSRSWALGILIGQWAHVVTDIADTAGVMPFFPFSTEPVTVSMWKHAAAEGRYGDAVAYYSSLGGVWDLFWLVIVVLFARETLRRDYFRNVVVRADPRVWGALHQWLRLPEQGLLLLYRGIAFYGLARMTTWFLVARLDGAPFQPVWGGPRFVAGSDLSDAGFVEVAVRTSMGGALFALFLWACWSLFVHRLWERAVDPPSVGRSSRVGAAFDR